MALSDQELKQLAQQIKNNPNMMKQFQDAQSQSTINFPQSSPISQPPLSGLAQGVGQGVGAMLQAAPSIILEGKMPSQQKTNPLELMMMKDYMERNKPKTPQEELAEMELNAVKGGASPLQDTQGGLSGVSTAQPTAQATVEPSTSEQPRMIKVPKGKDKYGRDQYDWQIDPIWQKEQEKKLEQKYPSGSELKAKTEAEDTKKATQSALKTSIANSNDTLKVIQKVKSGKGYFGALGGLPSFPTDYDRKEWETNVDNLLARRIVDLMAEMKNASKTGATGMGALSEKELKVLQDASTTLKRTVGPKQAMQVLEDMEQKINGIVAEKQALMQGDTDIPSGIDPKDWNSATPEQKQEYLSFINKGK